ncbi:MAG: type IV secretion system DNA-binding domain-containing protein, partial [Gammaproteobacteria bacterium]|nr:type IV secretion system DNA-binding domain-containing protein [Gammaproteobacteria bacterium]
MRARRARPRGLRQRRRVLHREGRLVLQPLLGVPQWVGGARGALLLAASALVCAGLLRYRGTRERHRRGALILEGRAARGEKRRRGRGDGVVLAGVPLRAAEETRHFKLMGTTGSGKSTAI